MLPTVPPGSKQPKPKHKEYYQTLDGLELDVRNVRLSVSESSMRVFHFPYKSVAFSQLICPPSFPFLLFHIHGPVLSRLALPNRRTFFFTHRAFLLDFPPLHSHQPNSFLMTSMTGPPFRQTPALGLTSDCFVSVSPPAQSSPPHDYGSIYLSFDLCVPPSFLKLERHENFPQISL